MSQYNMVKFNKLFYIVAICVIVLILYSAHFFYFWNINSFYLHAVACMPFLLYLSGQGRFSTVSIKDIGLILLFIIITCVGVYKGFALDPIVSVAAIFFVMRLNTEEMNKILDIWIWTFAIILGVSFIAYLLVPLGVLHSFGVTDFGDQYFFQNYGLVLISTSIWDIRYLSLFLEPGHVAMIGCFTLYAAEYDFKRVRTWLIVIPLIFTFSLAAYVVGIIGYFVFRIAKQKENVRFIRFAPAIILLLVGWNYFSNKDGGNNVVNEKIIQRLQYDDYLIISGNDRFHGETDKIFKDMLKDGSLLLGVGTERYGEMLANDLVYGAGYKLFLIQRGLIILLLVFLFYYLLAKNSLNKRFMIGLLIVYAMTFLQRAYPLWDCWVIIYILCTSVELTQESSVKKINIQI